jgi:VIT1/CCC1 family predicted Fe2+/Mn2+ transporter
LPVSYRERHRVGRMRWLRAAVLAVNDGLALLEFGSGSGECVRKSRQLSWPGDRRLSRGGYGKAAGEYASVPAIASAASFAIGAGMPVSATALAPETSLLSRRLGPRSSSLHFWAHWRPVRTGQRLPRDRCASRAGEYWHGHYCIGRSSIRNSTVNKAA